MSIATKSIENKHVSPILEAALDYAKKGIPVFPCWPHKKNPYLETGFKEASTDKASIKSWWTKWPDAWIGIPTGKASGFVVLDIDIKNERKGRESLKKQLNGTSLPTTKTVKTVSGGEHYYFKAGSQDIRNFKGKNGSAFDGIDVRGDGGYVIVPPSPGYEETVNMAIDELPLAPEWISKLKSLAAGGAGKEPVKGGKLGPNVGVGERDVTFFLHARKLAEAGMTEAEAVGALSVTLDKYTEDNPDDPFTLADVRKKVKSAYRKEYKKGERAVVGDGEQQAHGKGVPFRTMSGTQIMKQGADLPPIQWIVQGILPEGSCMLVGAPKIGKSFFAACLAIAVATGKKALGAYKTTKGTVLYLAADDRSLRRFYSRTVKMKLKTPANFHASFEPPPRLGEGFEEGLTAWLDAHPATKLVIIDIYNKIAPVSGTKNGNTYYDEAAAVTCLTEMAKKHKIALLILHHDRKAVSPDIMDSTSGTKGLSGETDGTMFLNRERGQMDAQLTVIHREVMGDPEIALKMDDKTGAWKALGDAYVYKKSAEQLEMWKYFEMYPEKQTAKLIAERTGGNVGTVRNRLAKMAKDKTLQSEKIGNSIVYWNGYAGKQDIDK